MNTSACPALRSGTGQPTLLRRGFKDAEGEDFNKDIERTIRAPVPPEAIHALLLLSLDTEDMTAPPLCLHRPVLLLV